jgi:hypothetical protein
MDAEEFKRAIERLGYNQSSFSRDFGIPLRTVQNWAKRGAPAHLARILGSTLHVDIGGPLTGALDNPIAARFAACEAASGAISAILSQGERAGWPRAILVAGMMQFLLDRISENQ